MTGRSRHDELRAAIQRERDTRHQTPEMWRERAGEHWPAAIAQTLRDADAAVDALLGEVAAAEARAERAEAALREIRDLSRDGPYRHPKQIARDALAAAAGDTRDTE